jgi:hypothetical protein
VWRLRVRIRTSSQIIEGCFQKHATILGMTTQHGVSLLGFPATSAQPVQAPSTNASFCCAPGAEALAEELATLVGGSWETVTWVPGVFLMANGASVPRDPPEGASSAARHWWDSSVTTLLRSERTRQAGVSGMARTQAESPPTRKGSSSVRPERRRKPTAAERAAEHARARDRSGRDS